MQPGILRYCLIVLVFGCSDKRQPQHTTSDTSPHAPAAPEPVDPGSSAPGTPATIEMGNQHASSVPSFQYAVVRSYGSGTGPLAFTEVGPAASTDSGLLVVIDRGVCQLVLIDLRTGAYVRRISRCGKGPGEFTFGTAIGIRGESILLWDDASRRLLNFSTNGEERRRYYLPADISEVDQIAWLNDSMAVLSTALFVAGRPLRDSTDQQLLVLNLSSGKVETRFHPISRYANGNPAPITYNVATCSHHGARILVLENWDFEGSIYSTQPRRLISHFKTQARAFGPEPERTSPDARRPKTIAFGVACPQHLALLWHVHSKPGAPRLFLAGGRAELRDYDGRLIAATDFGESDSLFMTRPVAAFGDEVILATNRLGSFPHLIHARLEIAGQ